MSTVRIMTWELDFANMTAKIHSRPDSISSDESCTHVKLMICDGLLCYRYVDNTNMGKPRVVANTGSSTFDSAVKRAWSDFCFEEMILKTKGESREQQAKSSTDSEVY